MRLGERNDLSRDINKKIKSRSNFKLPFPSERYTKQSCVKA